MRFRRLRQRLVAGFGTLLLALVAGTVAIVAAQTAGPLLESVREGLERAPGIFDDSMLALVREFEQVGDRFESHGGLAEYRRTELALREESASQRYVEHLASLRYETWDLFVNPENQPHGPDLVLVANPDMRLVVDIRGRDPDPELAVRGLADPEPRPTGEMPAFPGLSDVLRDGRARGSYLVYPDAGGTPTLYLVCAWPLRVQVGEGLGVDGVVVLGRALLRAQAAQVARLTGCATAFVARGGQVTASTRPDGEPLPEAVVRELGGGPGQRVLAGREYLVGVHPLPDAGQVVFLRDLDAVRAGVRRQVLLLALLGAAALGVMLLLSWRISAHVSRPIEALATRMRRVGEGDLDQQAEVLGEDEVAQLSASFNAMTAGLRQKEALKTMVPEAARRDIERDPSGRIVLGGRRVEATIMFSDLRGFTSMSEAATPTAVVELLNEYLAAMTVVIQRHHGDINEYIGDAILAVFHDRADTPGPVLAVRASLEMQEALEALRLRTRNEILRGLRMGIGLHTGDLVEGYIGAANRTKWGLVGDTVNLAARIQDRSRDGRHTCILVSGATRERLGETFSLAFFGDEIFKGKTGTTPVWEIVG